MQPPSYLPESSSPVLLFYVITLPQRHQDRHPVTDPASASSQAQRSLYRDGLRVQLPPFYRPYHLGHGPSAGRQPYLAITGFYLGESDVVTHDVESR